MPETPETNKNIPSKKSMFIYALILAIALPLPYLFCFDVCEWRTFPAIFISIFASFSITGIVTIVLVPIYTGILFFLGLIFVSRLKYSHHIIFFIAGLSSLILGILTRSSLYYSTFALFKIASLFWQVNRYQTNIFFDIIFALGYILTVGPLAIFISRIGKPTFKREGIMALSGILILSSFFIYTSILNTQFEQKFTNIILNTDNLNDCEQLRDIKVFPSLYHNSEVVRISDLMYESCVDTYAVRTKNLIKCSKLHPISFYECARVYMLKYPDLNACEVISQDLSLRDLPRKSEYYMGCRKAYFNAIKSEDPLNAEYQKYLVPTTEVNLDIKQVVCDSNKVVGQIHNTGNRGVELQEVNILYYNEVDKEIGKSRAWLGSYPNFVRAGDSIIVCDLFPLPQWNKRTIEIKKFVIVV